MSTRTAVAVLMSFALAACADAPSGPGRAPLAAPVSVASNSWTNVSGAIYNSCGATPELVLLQGREYFVVTVLGDSARVQASYDGLMGVGEVTGDRYVTQVSTSQAVIPAIGSSTIDVSERAISSGTAGSMFIVIHETVAFPGPVITTSFTMSCTG